MPADEVRERGAARTHVFEAAQALAAALAEGNASERWEPLRDLIIAGLQAGGLHHVSDSAAVRTASGELAAAALNARRRLAGQAPLAADRPNGS